MTALSIETIKKIYDLGYKIYFLNVNIELKKSNFIDDYFYFEISEPDINTNNNYILKYPLSLLTYEERRKIFIDEIFFIEASMKL